MSEPISAAAAAFANWAYATFFSAAGYGTTAHAAIVATLYYGGQIALSAAVSAGLNSLARAQINEPEAGKLTRRQPRPERMLQVGDWSRVSGAYMLRESRGNKLGVVLAQCDGRGEVRSVWLNDDLVTRDVNGWVQEGDDGRFGTGDLIQIKTRNGGTPEEAFTELFTTFGDLWTADHRGDGIQSLMMLAQHRSKESFSKHFPNGEPIPSSERRTFCYDWRDPDQSRDDPTTWKASANPVVWLVFVRWHRLGMKWDRCIAPVLEALTVEADYCDALAARKDGAPEPRYRCAFSYGASAEPQAYIDQITASFDGWMTTNGQGHLIIKAGRYEAPVFTLTEDHILGYRGWRAFDYREDATNVLKISYVSAAQNYTEVECDPWIDEADVETVGEEREASLQLLAVNSHSQARRLAKRQMARMNARRRGQILADIHGLNALGQRFIRLQNAELKSMANVVVEVLNVDIDLDAGMVVFDVVQADPNVDSWNPATEEGVEPSAQGRPAREPLEPPTLDAVGMFTDSIGETTGPRLSIQATGPNRGDETWFHGWRVVGDVSWVEGTSVDSDPGTPVLLETGFVAATTIEVRVAYSTGGGEMSPWSDAETADATIPAEALVSLDFVNNTYRDGVSTASTPSGLTAWSFARSTAAYAQDAAGALTSFAAGAPRINDRGFLVEAAKTNLCLRSQELNSTPAWAYTNATVSANAALAPDGTMTADTLLDDAVNGLHRAYQVITVVNGSTYATSAYVKPAGRTRIELIETDLGGALFDLTGAGSVVSGAGAIEALANGWYRIAITKTMTDTQWVTQLRLATGAGTTYVGSGVGVHVWGCQTELDAVTTYIPTAGASATRAADVAAFALATGATADPLTVVWEGGADTFTRADLANPNVLNFVTDSQGWVGRYVQTLTVNAA